MPSSVDDLLAIEARLDRSFAVAIVLFLLQAGRCWQGWWNRGMKPG